MYQCVLGTCKLFTPLPAQDSLHNDTLHVHNKQTATGAHACQFNHAHVGRCSDAPLAVSAFYKPTNLCTLPRCSFSHMPCCLSMSRFLYGQTLRDCYLFSGCSNKFLDAVMTASHIENYMVGVSVAGSLLNN